MNEDEIRKYRVLIVEDVPKELSAYRNAIKRACKGEINLEILEADSCSGALSKLKRFVVPFCSVDRNLPDSPKGQVKVENGDKIRELATVLNPLGVVSVLTGMGDPPSAHDAGLKGVFYAEKSRLSPSEYAERFVGRIREFGRHTVWYRAADLLPAPLGQLCARIGSQAESDFQERQDSALRLWEAGVRMTLLFQIALLDYFGENRADFCSRLRGRLDNDLVITWSTKLLSKSVSCLSAMGRPDLGEEIARFFDEIFFDAAGNIQRLRNKASHFHFPPGTNIMQENLPIFVNFSLGLGFWAVHPLITGLRLMPYGGKNSLQGVPLSGPAQRNGRQVWSWTREMEFLIDPAHVYQCLSDLGDSPNSVLIPLFPLIRVTREHEQWAIWLAENPTLDQYINYATGESRRFDDELSRWWQSQDSRQDEIQFTSGEKDDGLKEFGTDRDGKNAAENAEPEFTFAQRLRNFLCDFYNSSKPIDPEFRDAVYQQSFDGVAKAHEVLDFLQSQVVAEEDRAGLVYVSIGGGDGSEIAHVLTNSEIRRGILLEYSDFGAVHARRIAEDLARQGKDLYVLQGDVMQRLDECCAKLRYWSQSKNSKGVIVSVHSVLHELPARSPGYDPNVLIGKLFEPFTTRLFYCREPATPTGWPPTVQIRVDALRGEILHGISHLVNASLSFRDRVELLADHFVQMSAPLAVEVIFKIIYASDIERFKYEMEEQLTSFQPEQFAKILVNYIKPHENVECSYLITETFRKMYKLHGVHARSPDGQLLGLPICFARLTAFQA